VISDTVRGSGCLLRYVLKNVPGILSMYRISGSVTHHAGLEVILLLYSSSSSSSHIGVYPVTPIRCARKTMLQIREVGSLLDYPSGPVTFVLQLHGISTDTT
jgi:hypothetical protein